MQPIDDRPEIRSLLRNAAEWSFTILMWALWVYFFLPLLSLILWVAGAVHLYKTLFREEVIGELLAMLVKVGWLVLLVFIILRGWGIYNYYLFGRRNRRKNYPVTSASEIGRHFGLTEEEVRSLQQKKEIVWTELYDDIREKTPSKESK